MRVDPPLFHFIETPEIRRALYALAVEQFRDRHPNYVVALAELIAGKAGPTAEVEAPSQADTQADEPE